MRLRSHPCAQVACELELWQEAFRSVEDIQGLAAMGRKAPKPQLMATYYAQLTRVFTVSGVHLYNGCARVACIIHAWTLRAFRYLLMLPCCQTEAS